ncbi:hypothetical protein E1301_Tti006718 [Triplophysa tibetana]|uniref:Uncharacterized protein n=1 Tax=Triplophysa tibetana TaxID=1572043 RepID=A0A5A9N2X2_9TELE|nr:hypothetical protein E1301_Tti006718 [Triplophysa tibetana]
MKLLPRPIGVAERYYLMIIHHAESGESMEGGGAPGRRVQGGAMEKGVYGTLPGKSPAAEGINGTGLSSSKASPASALSLP